MKKEKYYIDSTEENIKKFEENDIVIGIGKKEFLLNSDFIGIDEFGTLFNFYKEDEEYIKSIGYVYISSKDFTC